jgi:hypothetical protein
MAKRPHLRKETDYETRFRCGGGIGILREEVWVNAHNEVVEYNRALILPFATSVDKGRVLGYDNAHGIHEKHSQGETHRVPFNGYRATARRFYREAEPIRRSYEG